MQMAAQAGLLPDEAAIEAVVAQIGSFDQYTPATTVKGDAARGRDFYSMTCGACHGPEAVGNEALNSPSLRGIDDWYLLRQYSNFRDGIRGSHAADAFGQQMQRMGQVLKTENDIRDVAAYLASLGIDG
jgi:cytochrome c oxidase subunit 2